MQQTFYHTPSQMYVDHSTVAEGFIKVRLRAINPPEIASVAIRYLDDAEPVHIKAEPYTPTHTVNGELWWEARLPVVGPVQHYRWHIAFTSRQTLWLNALGEHKHTVPDHGDFKVQVTGFAPEWYRKTSVYQIFIDRFACSETHSGSRTKNQLPDWASGWVSENIAEFKDDAQQRYLYGGDLWGIIDRLDYIKNLGFETIYLTPFFEARSSHRYDAHSFDRVDPFLGGDEALIALIDACHQRGMKLIGDLTTNHTGISHEWFQTALADENSEERSYYYWNSDDDYACWLGVKSLPKLNYNSQALRQRMYGPGGVVRRYLEPPFNMDGWRIDVANMTGRYRLDDFNHEVSLLARQAVEACGPDKALIAEHCHDFGPDIKGDTWHGSMNYAGFTRPFWDWLCPEQVVPRFLGTLADIHPLSGPEVVDTIDAFGAETTWQVRAASYNLVSSHDTPRISDTLVGPFGARVGLAAAYTLPGVPMVLYGEELGLPNVEQTNCRVPMPWHALESFANDMGELLRDLAGLRQLPVISEGGLRWVHVTDDVIAFWRETASQRLLVCLTRAQLDAISFPDPLAFAVQPALVYAGEVSVATDGQVEVKFDKGLAIARFDLA